MLSAPTRSMSRRCGEGFMAPAIRSGPTCRWSRCSAASRWPAGTSPARRWASRSTSCWAAGCMSACAATPTSIRISRRARTRAFITTPTARPQRAAEYVAQGFTAVKFDPAGPYSAFDPRQPDLESLDRSERFAKAIREAVGSKADLLFGTHGQFTPSGAIRMAKRLEPYDPLWFEEPVPPEMPEEMAKVARQTSHPHRHRRAALHQVRIRPRAGDRRGVDPADGAGPRRRAAGGQEDRRHGRSALRADRAASLLRAGRGRGEHPDQHLHAQLS